VVVAVLGLAPAADATKAHERGGQRHRGAYAPVARLRAILLVPIMLAALAPAVFLGLGGRSVSRYGPAACAQHTVPAPSRHGAFLSVPQRLAYQRLPDG
jgi:hypothetical protein